MTADICTRQDAYIARSTRVTLTDISEWPYYRLMWHNVIATVGPVL